MVGSSQGDEVGLPVAARDLVVVPDLPPHLHLCKMLKSFLKSFIIGESARSVLGRRTDHLEIILSAIKTTTSPHLFRIPRDSSCSTNVSYFFRNPSLIVLSFMLRNSMWLLFLYCWLRFRSCLLFQQRGQLLYLGLESLLAAGTSRVPFRVARILLSEKNQVA